MLLLTNVFFLLFETNYSDLLVGVKDYQKIVLLWKQTAALLKNDSLKMVKIWVTLVNDSAVSLASGENRRIKVKDFKYISVN